MYLVSVEGEAEGVLGLDVIVKGPSRQRRREYDFPRLGSKVRDLSLFV